jgi:hypothetical protein
VTPLLSHNEFIAVMQRSYLATQSACLATLCFVATTWTINAISRQATAFAPPGHLQLTGLKRELFLWRVHREHLQRSLLRKQFVLLWCAGIFLFAMAAISIYYRENVAPVHSTISSI